jgi:glycine betaine/proline transport system permease protein
MYSFPSLDTQVLKVLRQTIDSYFFSFSRNYGESIESIFSPLAYVLQFSEDLLVNTPWFLVLLVISVISYITSKDIKLTVLVTITLFIIGVFGMWQDSMTTISIVLISMFICLLIGIPTGIIMSTNDTVKSYLLPILDLMQAIPTFVYLIPIIMLLGIGDIPGLLAIIIYSIPPTIRFTDIGIREVGKEYIESAKSLGMTNSQILFKIKIPLAYTNIFAGINQTIMMTLGMVVIASMIGLEGLGRNVLRAVTNQYLTMGLLNGLAIVAIAILLDRLSQSWAKNLQPWRHVA